MICDQFKDNRSINPLTGKKIKLDSYVYKLLSQSCKTKDICNTFEQNRNINPITSKNISENSKIKLFFNKFCQDQQNKSKEMKINEKLVFKSDEPCTIYANFTLKEHQLKTIKYMKNNNRLLLFHSVGSGKTATSIGIIRCLLQWDSIPINKKIYIVTPTSLVENYKKEIKKLGIDLGDRIEINSYGIFLNKYKNKIEKFRDAGIVIDEAHNFKTQIKYGKSGLRIHDMLRLTNVAKGVILLSATPVQNNVVDFANLYAILKNKEDELLENPNKFYSQFEKNWKEIDLNGIISIYTNVERGDFPKMNEYFIKFEMTDDYYKLYKHIEESEEHKFFGKNLKIFYNGIRRAINRVDETIPTPKIIWTVDKIKENLNHNKKTLVYSNWLESGIRIVQKELDKLNIRWMEVSGSIPPKIRNKVVDSYNRGDIKVLFVTAAGAEGLDLKETRTIIIIEPHWNNERIKQIIGRGVRYKSHESLPIKERVVDVYRLILQKPKNKMKKKEMLSADEFMLQISEKKEKEITKLYKKMMTYNILKNN